MAASCTYCNEEDNDEMVQCDTCDAWVHFSCAGVNSEIKSHKWECKTCVAATAARAQEFTTPITSMDKSGANGQVSDSYNSGNVNVLKKRSLRKLDIEMELLKLEENKKVELAMIEKKFELLKISVQENEEIKQNLNIKSNNDDEYKTLHTKGANCVSSGNGVRFGQEDKYEPARTITAEHSNELLNFQQLSSRQAVPRDLPLFTGKPEEWLVFISSFENSTRMCGFSHDENLLRLQKALKGKALDCVSSKLMIPALVPEILSTLKMMFGRPDQIINNILAKIRMQPSVNLYKLESLITLALELKNLTAAMEATGLKAYYNNPMLVQELVEKLPAPMRLEWGRYRGKENLGDLKLLSDWLYDQAETASTVSSTPAYSYTDTERRKTHRVGFHKEEKKLGHGSQRSIACYNCGENHVLTKCEKFLKLQYNERWEKVKELKVCSCCLKSHNSICRDRVECGINGCTKKHHQLLHKNDIPKENYGEPAMIATHHQQTSHMLYRIIPITIHGNGKSMNIYAFLDDGSGPTLIEKSILKAVNIKGERKDLCLKWTDGTIRTEKDSDILNLPVSPCGKNEKRFVLNSVRSVERLDLPSQTLNMEELTQKYKHLRGLPVKSYSNVVPHMIIGVNNKGVAMPLKYREGRISEPAATKTRLGWTVYGALSENSDASRENMQLHICQCDDEIALQSLVTESMKLEVNTTVEQDKYSINKQELQNIVTFENNHFVTRLLWKTFNESLPDSYPIALHRLKCFERKLNKEPELRRHVNEHIIQMQTKGYIRKLSPNEIATVNRRTWYLPIFTIRNPNKPQKVRLVWDAAAKCNGLSLNDCLDKGPDMLNSLLGVLFNFRTGKIGICGDICEMFHRVHVHEDDQQSQRFLWRNSENKNPDVYVLRVLSFGASCSPALAQFVKNHNAVLNGKDYPRAIKSIIERHYVDDMLDSVNTVDEAIKLAEEVKYVHSKGNFHIRNWLSNSREVIEALGGEGESDVFCSAGKRVEQIIEPSKVLGMWWNTREDVFTFNLKYTKANEDVLQGAKLPTKRQLLRLLMSIFDPMGFLSAYLINVKILFQKIWRCGIVWDEEIPREFAEIWKQWLSTLPGVTGIKIPRHYFCEWSHAECDIQLHVFVDAGESAFACVAYFRIQNEASVRVALIGSKTKVAPMRPISIPRMELLAAVMGVRFGEVILKQHDINIKKVKYWSDSKTVLSWIRSDAMNFKQFVMYRIGEIQENTSAEQWNYVPTKLNVADVATKLTSKPIIDPNSEWFRGPPFLQQPERYWPKQPTEKLKVEHEELRVPIVAVQVEEESSLINATRFSKWERLVNSMAYVKLFINNIKNKIKAKTDKNVKKQIELTDKELSWSYNIVIQHAQQQEFGKEINALKISSKFIPSKNSPLRKLSPFIDTNSVLRMQGRLANAKCINDEKKYPIILPKGSYVTSLIVDWYHRKYKHVNHETVINEVFQIYHVPGLRKLLKLIRNNCHICKIRTACPQPPEMGQLPEGRLSPFFRPFTHTGVDFFGPFLTVIGRRTEKRYGVVFTCLTCRAVHLEMAYGLTMNSCSITIRNFISRRGAPMVFYSDNGTNLKAAEKELRESLQQINFSNLRAGFTSAETRWEFIPPASPHMGGAWERMVRSIKNNMYRIITPGTKLTDEKLNNLFIEVENIINTRPLTYLSLETAEQEALTPNHFLLGSSTGSKPPGEFNVKDQYIKGSWRHSQYLADQFWKRWVSEMLPTLTKRTKWFQPAQPLAEGDVVIVVDPNSPRHSWPKGIVVKAIPGNDGQTRSAIVRTAHGQYHRPTTSLAVLDIKRDEVDLPNA